MNPYLITGPAQIGISGGRTSGHMVYKILEAHGGVLPQDVHLCFQNTGKEREETLQFIDQMAKRWGVQVTWMEWSRVYGQPDDAPWYKLVDFETASRNGEPFTMMLDYFAAYRAQEKGLPMWLPNFSNNACTAYLKIKIGEKHMRSLGYDEWDCVIGIRKDEPGRYHRMMAANAKGGARWDSVCPSYTAGIMKEDVAAFWQVQDFDLGMDSDLGNCDLCWKKGEDKLFKAIQAEPERVIFWSGLEEKFNQVFRMDRPKYSHLAWYAENYKGQMDAFGYPKTSTASAATNPNPPTCLPVSGGRGIPMATAETIDRFLRLDEVLHTTGLGRNTVYRRIREGTFPKQVRIGPNSVAWRQSAIAEWMTSITPSNDQSVH